MNCTNCRCPVPDGALRCPYCGAPQTPAPRFDPAAGGSVPQFARQPQSQPPQYIPPQFIPPHNGPLRYAPAQYAPPISQPVKKSRAPIIIAVAAVVLVAAAAVFVLFFTDLKDTLFGRSGADSPEKAADISLSALADGDAEAFMRAMYADTDDMSKAERERLTSEIESDFFTDEDYSDFVYRSIEEAPGRLPDYLDEYDWQSEAYLIELMESDYSDYGLSVDITDITLVTTRYSFGGETDDAYYNELELICYELDGRWYCTFYW